MNPITVFLTVAGLAVGVGLGATGHIYAGIPLVIAAIIIAPALKMANTWEKFVTWEKIRHPSRRVNVDAIIFWFVGTVSFVSAASALKAVV